MPDHLILRLEAPLMAFGGTMIDANGPTLEFPLVSLVTGLIANALGLRREEREAHQRLQERIVMGVRIDRPGTELRDFQTAQLSASDKGWTTRGEPERRAGGAATYKSPHIRLRYHRADACVIVAMRLEPADEFPTLADISAAFEYPARPLFIGRKPCLPSGPILAAPPTEAENVLAALSAWPLAWTTQGRTRRDATPEESITVVIPAAEPRPAGPHRATRLTDHRDWISGVHAGESELYIFRLPRASFPPHEGTRL